MANKQIKNFKKFLKPQPSKEVVVIRGDVTQRALSPDPENSIKSQQEATPPTSEEQTLQLAGSHFTGSGKTMRRRMDISPVWETLADGMKHRVQDSANTATFVRLTYGVLVWESTSAMEFAQQVHAENKNEVTVETIRKKYPTVDKLANRYEVELLVKSKPGHPDATKWTKGVLSRALQKPEDTIAKYARTEPRNNLSVKRRKVLPRRTK